MSAGICSVTPTQDAEAITAICRDPWISKAGHDHRPTAYIDHPNVRYLAAVVDGEMVGCFLLIESGFVEVDVHALLLRKAIQHVRRLGRACLDYIFRQPDIARVTAYVIEGLESARNYVLKLGFQPEGFRRDACLKNGRLVGVHVLGMTRADWERSA